MDAFDVIAIFCDVVGKPPDTDGMFPVVLTLADGEDVDLDAIPGGVTGTGVVYTKSAKASHVFRKITLRMETWKNFVLP